MGGLGPGRGWKAVVRNNIKGKAPSAQYRGRGNSKKGTQKAPPMVHAWVATDMHQNAFALICAGRGDANRGRVRPI